MMNYPFLSFENKICSPDRLAQWVPGLARPLVFTNGCFDILHRGHVTYLSQARSLGASLIVAINTDDSVRRQGKGVGRPLNKQADRAALLAALESVDRVTWFDQDTPIDLIMAICPDILVKGGDWPVEQIVGSQEVLAWHGQVHSIPFLFDISTTKIIEKMEGIHDAKPKHPRSDLS